MALAYKTLCWGTLGANLGNNPSTDLTITLSAGHGARFSGMLVTANDYTWLSIIDLADATKPIERVKVIGPVSGDALTVAPGGRAADGTTIRSFNASGSPPPRVEMRLCKPILDEFVTADDYQTLKDARAASVGGTPDAVTVTHTLPLSRIVGAGGVPTDGMLSIFVPTADSASSAPTFTPDGLTTKTIKGPGGPGLPAAALSVNRRCILIFSTALDAWEMVTPMWATLPTGTRLPWPQRTPPGWALTEDGSAVTRSTYSRLYDLLCPQFTGAVASGTVPISGLASTLDRYIGEPVESAFLPASTTVSKITSLTAIEVSQPATGTSGTAGLRFFPNGAGDGVSTFNLADNRELFFRGATGTARGTGYDETILTGTTISAANTVTGLSSTDGLYIGQALSATAGIPGGTTISEISSATAIKMSANATTSGSKSITFTGRRFGSEQGSDNKTHAHVLTLVFGSGGSAGILTSGAGVSSGSGYISSSGGVEARPRNRNALPIIVY